MLMIVVDEAKKEELEVFLNHSGVEGYTELSHAAGMGSTGPRLGSRAFPKSSAVVFSMVRPEALERLTTGNRGLLRHLRRGAQDGLVGRRRPALTPLAMDPLTIFRMPAGVPRE